MAIKRRTDDYFRKRFKIERERRKWSQADVAELLKGKGVHVPVTAIAKVEAGTRTVRIDEAVAIADLFEVSLDSLLGRGAGLEDDLAYSLRALREVVQRIYSQVRPLTMELIEARDEAINYAFSGRENLVEFTNIAIDRLTTAAVFLSLAETYTHPEFAVPGGTVVKVDIEGANANHGLDADEVRALFDTLATRRAEKGLIQ